jgi:hypothetical protein
MERPKAGMNGVELEAPPGFEPGMEVLQAWRRAGDVWQIRVFPQRFGETSVAECR